MQIQDYALGKIEYKTNLGFVKRGCGLSTRTVALSSVGFTNDFIPTVSAFFVSGALFQIAFVWIISAVLLKVWFKVNPQKTDTNASTTNICEYNLYGHGMFWGVSTTAILYSAVFTGVLVETAIMFFSERKGAVRQSKGWLIVGALILCIVVELPVAICAARSAITRVEVPGIFKYPAKVLCCWNGNRAKYYVILFVMWVDLVVLQVMLIQGTVTVLALFAAPFAVASNTMVIVLALSCLTNIFSLLYIIFANLRIPCTICNHPSCYSTAQDCPSSTSQGDPNSTSQGDPNSTSQGDPNSTSQGDPSSTAQGDPSSTSQGDPNSTSQGDPNSTSQGDPNSTAQGDPSSTSQGDPSSTARGDPNSTAQGDPNSTARGNPSSTSQGDPNSTARGDPSSTAQGDPSSTSQGDPNSTARGDPSSTARSDPSSTARGDPSSTARGDPSSTAQGDPSSMAQEDSSSTAQEDSSSAAQDDSSSTICSKLQQLVQEGTGSMVLSALVLLPLLLMIMSYGFAIAALSSVINMDTQRNDSFSSISSIATPIVLGLVSIILQKFISAWFKLAAQWQDPSLRQEFELDKKSLSKFFRLMFE